MSFDVKDPRKQAAEGLDRENTIARYVETATVVSRLEYARLLMYTGDKDQVAHGQNDSAVALFRALTEHPRTLQEDTPEVFVMRSDRGVVWYVVPDDGSDPSVYTPDVVRPDEIAYDARESSLMTAAAMRLVQQQANQLGSPIEFRQDLRGEDVAHALDSIDSLEYDVAQVFSQLPPSYEDDHDVPDEDLPVPIELQQPTQQAIRELNVQVKRLLLKKKFQPQTQ